MANALAVNPGLSFLQLSALRAWGLRDWFDFLRHESAWEHASA
jgi:hypothetical protein